jgi:hypothetical protein
MITHRQIAPPLRREPDKIICSRMINEVFFCGHTLLLPAVAAKKFPDFGGGRLHRPELQALPGEPVRPFKPVFRRS